MPGASDEEQPDGGETDHLRACIDEFESIGAASFAIGEEQELYGRFMEYTRRVNAPTQTDIDEAGGLIVVSRRSRGAMDGAFFL